MQCTLTESSFQFAFYLNQLKTILSIFVHANSNVFVHYRFFQSSAVASSIISLGLLRPPVNTPGSKSCSVVMATMCRCESEEHAAETPPEKRGEITEDARTGSQNPLACDDSNNEMIVQILDETNDNKTARVAFNSGLYNNITVIDAQLHAI
jgi:hypothetical protein